MCEEEIDIYIYSYENVKCSNFEEHRRRRKAFWGLSSMAIRKKTKAHPAVPMTWSGSLIWGADVGEKTGCRETGQRVNEDAQ